MDVVFTDCAALSLEGGWEGGAEDTAVAAAAVEEEVRAGAGSTEAVVEE